MVFRHKDKNSLNLTINKKIPILILDQRWHALFPEENKDKKIKEYEAILNKLLQEQGKLNTELKEYKTLKKKMMQDILNNMTEALEENDDKASKLLEKNKQYIYDINQKLTNYEQRLEELPKIIKDINEKLLNASLNICYQKMKYNKDIIEELKNYIDETKNTLKNKILEKQDLQDENSKIYTYMHDLLGYEAINIFDEQYIEEE